MFRKYFVYGLSLVLLLSMFSPMSNSALAGPEDILWSDARPFRAISPLIPESGILFLEPVADKMSGSSERVVTGQDSRFDNGKKQAMQEWMDSIDGTFLRVFKI